jgi:hypothetical protein
MAVENDESLSLPRPPPPRPARREAAIEAALRKFDGTDEGPSVANPEVTARPPLTWWARTHRPQLGVLVSAALIAVIGVPAALIAIRDQAPTSTPERASPTAIEPGSAPSQAQRAGSPKTTVAEAPSATPEVSAPPHARREPSKDFASVANRARTEETAPSSLVAAAPPPPPAPPPPTSAEKVAEAPLAQGVIVTGSRIPKPNTSSGREEGLDRKSGVAAQRAATSDAAGANRFGQDHKAFLSRLQVAVRANDRGAVIKLIDFPLRVNSQGRTRLYRDAQSVQRDYDRIFTPQVRRAILGQRVDQLFVRDQGVMIGNGEVWFDQTCPNAACSPPGPVRIEAVNL